MVELGCDNEQINLDLIHITHNLILLSVQIYLIISFSPSKVFEILYGYYLKSMCLSQYVA